ncbi:FAD-dependent oxidoreductase [Selenihalanaerobacter shriftii]|uniref:NADPH-dependent glutamate synthase beta chain n=1 Tax=Selenihalanaerobacter shriftii TaxID=142842 RepID=A0A1T4K500_9FIRM|nr:FAD-dependent oxidoreductase [Selenihalanaerobacter shriftii]SJZ37528.1 NADPH-dependent glutamate synthase beta chain [Selenihalanaerobacter shriftii]
MLSTETIEAMNEIVEDCMGDAPPYCQATCPLHIDVKGYVDLISEGEYKESLELIRETTPFPGILGRICAHPCEEECKRQELESALSIKNLKRFVSDLEDDPQNWDFTSKDESGNKVAIIGAGPTGALAAYDLRKEGHQVTIFEALPVVGGMLSVGIPDYRLPQEVIDREYSILEKLGVKIELNTRVGNDISFAELEDKFDAVFVAHGAHESIMLPLPGAELEGVLPGVDFLRDATINRDNVKMGKKVVVIGGGNVAIDVARTAWRFGAEEVHLLCLESREEMPAHSWEVEDAEEEEVQVHCGWGPKEIQGQDKVTGISFKKCTSVRDEEGNFAPNYDEEQIKELEADTVILAIGQNAESDFLKDDDKVELNRGDKVKVDPVTLQTDKDHVFAGGDNAGRPLLAIEAMAHGRKAATSINLYLKGQELHEDRDQEGTFETWLETEIDDNESKEERVDMRMLSIDERRGNFEEVELGFSEVEARRESKRCLQCECKLCMQECVMLNDYCESPKDLFAKIIENEDVDPIIPYSCNMCSQCTIVCPKEFPIKMKFMKIRKDMVKANDGKSPMKGHNAIEMHQFLGFSWLFNTAKSAKDKGSA